MGMKIRGILLATVEEQRAGGDNDPLDPAMVPLDEQEVPVTLNFDHARTVGKTTRLWVEDGRLMFEAEIVREDLLEHTEDEQYEADTAALGYVGEHTEGKTTKVKEIFSVGLTGENSNSGQPPWEGDG